MKKIPAVDPGRMLRKTKPLASRPDIQIQRRMSQPTPRVAPILKCRS
jgi:hypothetical protein